MNEQHSSFLDRVREAGQINMYGAVPYLMMRFHISEPEAKEILAEWMRSKEE